MDLTSSPEVRKKILYIITQSEFGGAQRYLFELITHLDPQKYEITVAAGAGGDLLDRLKAQNCRIWPLKHLVRSINPYYDILAYFELKKLIRTIKPDILQLHSTKAGILGSLAARKYKRAFTHFRSFASISQFRIIYRIGGWAFTEDLPKWKKWLYIKLEKWTAKYKDIIVNNCEAHRQLAIKLGIAPPEKIKTIYNGIDIEKLKFLPREQARQKLMVIGHWSLVIGTIANFYKNKGLEYLVRSAVNDKCQMINVKYIIIGDGIERPNLEKLIRGLKLENRVFLPGKIKDAWRFLKAFDIFVLPSIKEGQPWSILEAMAAEIPIIATNIAAIPEMLKDGESGLLVEPKNPEAIREKIEYLMAHPDLAKKLGQEAKRVLEERFGIEKMVRETEKLYN